VTRRTFLKRAAVSAAAVTWTHRAWSAPNDLDHIRAEIENATTSPFGGSRNGSTSRPSLRRIVVFPKVAT